MVRDQADNRYGAGVAKGRGRRLQSAVGVLGVVALVTAYAMVKGWDPVSGVGDWLERLSPVSTPEPAWTARTGARPEHAVVAGRAIVVVMRDAVEARDAATGDKLWSREARWAAVAGTGSNGVVVASRGKGGGLEALDPATGAVRWDDGESRAVWTYREMLLTLTCSGQAECVLAGRAPADGRVLWRTSLPGDAKAPTGLNPALPGSQPRMSSTVDALAAAPGQVPALVGLPLAGRIHVVDTETGRRVREIESSDDAQVTVVGGRVLQVRVRGELGDCDYTIEARDPGTGQAVWRKDGYDLRTASGTICEQWRDPAGGGGGALSAVRDDGREVLLSAGDGRELWVGEPGERALATDGSRALVRTADGAAVRAVDLGGGTTLWEHEVDGAARVALTAEAAVIVVDDRLWARDPGSGRVLAEARTIASVIGCGPAGVVIASGRTVGLLPFTSPAAGASPEAGTSPGGGPPAVTSPPADGKGPADPK